jgi:hypothetical protein
MKTNASTQQWKQTLPRNNENKRFHATIKTNASTQQWKHASTQQWNKRFNATMKTNASTQQWKQTLPRNNETNVSIQQCNGDVTGENCDRQTSWVRERVGIGRNSCVRELLQVVPVLEF